MIDPQDKELDNIIKAVIQLKESGLKGKMIIYVECTEIKDCEILTKLDLTEN